MKVKKPNVAGNNDYGDEEEEDDRDKEDISLDHIEFELADVHETH